MTVRYLLCCQIVINQAWPEPIDDIRAINQLQMTSGSICRQITPQLYDAYTYQNGCIRNLYLNNQRVCIRLKKMFLIPDNFQIFTETILVLLFSRANFLSMFIHVLFLNSFLSEFSFPVHSLFLYNILLKYSCNFAYVNFLSVYLFIF